LWHEFFKIKKLKTKIFVKILANSIYAGDYAIAAQGYSRATAFAYIPAQNLMYLDTNAKYQLHFAWQPQ
jgi:hypothetical protein